MVCCCPPHAFAIGGAGNELFCCCGGGWILKELAPGGGGSEKEELWFIVGLDCCWFIDILDIELPSEERDCEEALEEAQGLEAGAAAAPQFIVDVGAGGLWKEEGGGL